MAVSYSIFFGYVSSADLGFLQFCNLNSLGTKLVLGFSFFIGLSLPQYFREHHLDSNTGRILALFTPMLDAYLHQETRPFRGLNFWSNNKNHRSYFLLNESQFNNKCLIFMSHATVAATVALGLDCTLNYATNEARKDNGSYCWDKFMIYSKDVRNDGFYKYVAAQHMFPISLTCQKYENYVNCYCCMFLGHGFVVFQKCVKEF